MGRIPRSIETKFVVELVEGLFESIDEGFWFGSIGWPLAAAAAYVAVDEGVEDADFCFGSPSMSLDVEDWVSARCSWAELFEALNPSSSRCLDGWHCLPRSFGLGSSSC